MKVSLDKQYRTRDGQEVELHEIVHWTAIGRAASFPVKGSVIHRAPNGKRTGRSYGIWTIEGAYHLVKVWGEHPRDLIEVK